MWARREKERKAQELENFQRRVKHRVSQREREKQREMAYKSTELVQSEQRVAEKAVKLDKIKVDYKININRPKSKLFQGINHRPHTKIKAKQIFLHVNNHL